MKSLVKKFDRKRRRRKWIKAYKILKKEAARHEQAGHIMTFEAVNEALLIMRCTGCPNLQPQGKPRKAWKT